MYTELVMLTLATIGMTIVVATAGYVGYKALEKDNLYTEEMWRFEARRNDMSHHLFGKCFYRLTTKQKDKVYDQMHYEDRK